MAPTVGRDQTPVYAGRLEIRPADFAALVDGRPLTLTVRELQVLTELAQNAERVMTRQELYQAVWGRQYRKSDRSIDVYVGRLRTKLSACCPDGASFTPIPGSATGSPRKAERRLQAVHILFTSAPHAGNKIRSCR